MLGFSIISVGMMVANDSMDEQILRVTMLDMLMVEVAKNTCGDIGGVTMAP